MQWLSRLPRGKMNRREHLTGLEWLDLQAHSAMPENLGRAHAPGKVEQEFDLSPALVAGLARASDVFDL